MKLLIHTCCAPCLIAPFDKLQDNNLTLLFYNPNIHPFEEFNKRLSWVEQFAQEAKTDLITYHYNPDQYLNTVSFDLPKRCEVCYQLRLMETARIARMKEFDSFTSTLLVSPYQKHELVIELGSQASEKFDIPFYYEDFRPYYKEAKKTAKDIGIYLQKYCGCVFSLNEREEHLKVKNKK